MDVVYIIAYTVVSTKTVIIRRTPRTFNAASSFNSFELAGYSHTISDKDVAVEKGAGVLPLPRKHSPDGATTDCRGRHLTVAYYSFIDCERMKGYVGLVHSRHVVMHTYLVQRVSPHDDVVVLDA